MRNVRRSALAVAFCVLVAAHVAWTASLQDKEQRSPHLAPVEQDQSQHSSAPGVQRSKRETSPATLLELISQIARIGALRGYTGQQEQSSADSGGRPLNNFFLPSPVKLDGTNTSLQLVFIPVPVPSSQYKQSLQIEYVTPRVEPTFNTPNYYSSGFQNNIGQPIIVANVDIPQHTTPPVSTRYSIFNYEQQTTRPKISRPSTQPPQVIKNEVKDLPASSAPQKYPTPNEERPAKTYINFPPVDNSQELLVLFRAQMPSNPTLAPVLFESPIINTANDEDVGVSAQEQQPSSSNTPFGTFNEPEECRTICKRHPNLGKAPDSFGFEQKPPSPPSFERSMVIDAVLTVPSADYSENYTLWWDAVSGASRIEHHGGTASSYRITRSDGRVQSVHVRLDRTGKSDVRHCTISTPRRFPLAERGIPVLPDLSGFKFAGYIDVKPRPIGLLSRVERWVQTVSAYAGAIGAARGEALTYRHELIVTREEDSFDTWPLRYAVTVDSSVLGKNCEKYFHRFLKVNIHQYEPSTFSFDTQDACDTIEFTNQTELVEPLREFSLLQRDPKYDEMTTRYKRSYNRQYADDLEEAIRKNILIQSSRYVSSGNREGATFEMEVNFLSDRLKEELKPLNGVGSTGNGGGEPFPYSKLQLLRMSGRLPQNFDWRERGGVTPVRNQGTCASCWAFAVVGAVEGALFAKTNRLVTLSEQDLVDCGHRYGASGCKPTWPRFAYDYVQNMGLRPLDQYPSYVAKVQQCSASRVAPVTNIDTFVNVTRKDLIALKVAIRRNGPTVVLVDGENSNVYAYKKGYYSDAKCKKRKPSHAMLAVGWTVYRGETYFILKNSWTTGWGEGGYMYVNGKANTCGVLQQPSYPVVKPENVLRIPSSAPLAVKPITTSD